MRCSAELVATKPISLRSGIRAPISMRPGYFFNGDPKSNNNHTHTLSLFLKLRLTMQTTLLLSLLLSFIGAHAHMEMEYPPPRRSKFNERVARGDIDYDMNSPLNKDGSNFPCKGYGPGAVTAEFDAGSTIQFKAAGSTFHKGGHCQFSLSYDGKDFVVLKTVMKSCFTVTGTTIDVPIPATAPPCEKCTFAWSWVNAVGNREFYMNCADVKIKNPNAGAVLTGPKMTVANLPNFPQIGEFPTEDNDDGASFYTSAQMISVSGEGTSTAASQPQPQQQAAPVRAFLPQTPATPEAVPLAMDAQTRQQESSDVTPAMRKAIKQEVLETMMEILTNLSKS